MDFKEKLNELDKFIREISVGRVRKDGEYDKRYKHNWLYLYDRMMKQEHKAIRFED